MRLARFAYLPNCTLGVLTIPSTDLELYTIELPWLDNRRGKSCIPEGTYPVTCTVRYSNQRLALLLHDVPDRTEIMIHVANRPSELRGCIAPGLRLGGLRGEFAVLQSAQAMDYLIADSGMYWQSPPTQIEITYDARYAPA